VATQPHSKRPSTRVRIRIFFIFIFLSRKSGKLYQISPENARGNPWKNDTGRHKQLTCADCSLSGYSVYPTVGRGYDRATQVMVSHLTVI
jgi:hypothetical protein